MGNCMRGQNSRYHTRYSNLSDQINTTGVKVRNVKKNNKFCAKSFGTMTEGGDDDFEFFDMFKRIKKINFLRFDPGKL